ncbi:hypothetical protein [Spirosoma validum]|nr:hypothetical protein [Spirosoma validum]
MLIEAVGELLELGMDIRRWCMINYGKTGLKRYATQNKQGYQAKD